MKSPIGIIEGIGRGGGQVAGWFILVMMAIILVEISVRAITGRPPLLADEFGGYFMVAIAFLGLGFSWMEKGHVRMTALVSVLPPRVASWLRLITLVLVFAFTIVLTQEAYGFMAYSFKNKLRSPYVWRTPLQVPQMVIPIGVTLFSLLIAIEVARAIMAVRAGRNIVGEGRQ